MRSFWSDPFLWIHLAGLAALPLWLEICWLGLAAGSPVLPFWLELLVVAAIGIAPIFWMQWQRPFYIFSLITVVLKPAQLTEDQRRLLTLFRAQRNRFLAIAGAVIAFLALRQLYYLAPIAAPVTPFPAEARWLGVLVAAIAFLGVNLFLQVPISVLSVMLAGESAFAATEPYPLEQIRSDFTLLGIPVNQILPPVIAEPEPVVAAADLGVTAVPEVATPASELAPEPPSAEAEDWLEESPPPTIPDGELERGLSDTSAEPTTTEEDLKADLWDVETPIAPDAAAQEIVNPSVEPDLTSIAEDVAESIDTIDPEAIAHETSIDSVTVDNLAESVAAEEVVSSEENGNPEVISPEVISTAAELAAVAATSPSEAPVTGEEVDNSAAITDSEELDSSVEIASTEASTSPEAIANSEASTDSEAATPSEAISDSEVPPDSEAAVEPVETLNPDMVASAPTEAPAPNIDSPSSTHHAPEDQKE